MRIPSPYRLRVVSTGAGGGLQDGPHWYVERLATAGDVADLNVRGVRVGEIRLRPAVDACQWRVAGGEWVGDQPSLATAAQELIAYVELRDRKNAR